MILECIAKAIKKSGKSRNQISKDTGIDNTVLFRIVNGGSCSTKAADILCKYLEIRLMVKSQEKKKRELSKKDLDKMFHQVGYEHAMLSAIGDYVVGETIKDGLLRVALLESFLVHARNLIDFFYTDKVKFRDDILAVDYFSSANEWPKKRGKLPNYLDEAKTKANKLLSHITLSRIKKYKRDRGWPVLKIRNKIDDVFECFKKEKTL